MNTTKSDVNTVLKMDQKRTSRPLHLVAFPDKEGWRNSELTKDCGILPYLLHRNHNMSVTFVGQKMEEYPALETYLPGAEMEFLPSGSEQDKMKYLFQYGKQIDCLILRGAYDSNINTAIAYKDINPNGKIYIGLDANSYWMDSIRWDRPNFMHMMNNCDVIAVSHKAIQKHLNKKWPWKIEYLPNGYYSFGISQKNHALKRRKTQF